MPRDRDWVFSSYHGTSIGDAEVHAQTVAGPSLGDITVGHTFITAHAVLSVDDTDTPFGTSIWFGLAVGDEATLDPEFPEDRPNQWMLHGIINPVTAFHQTEAARFVGHDSTHLETSGQRTIPSGEEALFLVKYTGFELTSFAGLTFYATCRTLVFTGTA